MLKSSSCELSGVLQKLNGHDSDDELIGSTTNLIIIGSHLYNCIFHILSIYLIARPTGEAAEHEGEFVPQETSCR